MAMRYWSVAIPFWQLSIDHIVNGQCKRRGFAKTRLRHPSLPFDSLPYPTRTICRRVRTYVRSVSHVTTKRKEVDHILWVWGSVPRALRARGSPAIKLWLLTWLVNWVVTLWLLVVMILLPGYSSQRYGKTGNKKRATCFTTLLQK